MKIIDIKKKSDMQNIVNSSIYDQHIKILSISISRFHRSTYRVNIDQQIEILLSYISDRLRKNHSTAIENMENFVKCRLNTQRYMTGILPIQRKTQSNQSIN